MGLFWHQEGWEGVCGCLLAFCASSNLTVCSVPPTAPNSPGAGDLWSAPQNTAAHHRPTPDTSGESLTAGNELGGGEWFFFLLCSGSEGLFLHAFPCTVFPGRPSGGEQSCRRLESCSPTMKPRLVGRRRSRARSKAIELLGSVIWGPVLGSGGGKQRVELKYCWEALLLLAQNGALLPKQRLGACTRSHSSAVCSCAAGTIVC